VVDYAILPVVLLAWHLLDRKPSTTYRRISYLHISTPARSRIRSTYSLMVTPRSKSSIVCVLQVVQQEMGINCHSDCKAAKALAFLQIS
jgi:hypothetical protein